MVADTYPGAARPWRLAALTGVLLAGCVAYRPAPLDLKDSADHFEARRLGDAGLRAAVAPLLPAAHDAWPPQEWDRAQLLAVAWALNPQLDAARAQAAAIFAHERTAAQRPDPDLTLQSEYARHDAHPWLYGVSLAWLLRSSTRRGLDIEIAQLDTRSARMELMNEIWRVRQALVGALSDREAARRRLSLLARLAQAQDRLLDIERRRIAAGEDAPNAMVLVDQERVSIERRVAEQQGLLAAAETCLARSLGLPLEALEGVTLAWPEWGEPPPVGDAARSETRERALLSRADLSVAIQTYAIAEARLHQAVLKQYPEVELEPGYYWDHGIAKFPFDLGLQLPLNRNAGDIGEARTARKAAERQMLALQAGIIADIAGTQRSETLARRQLAAAELLLDGARRQQSQAELTRRLGESESQEAAVMVPVVLRAELDVVDSRADLQDARNSLENALHAPVSGPELAITDSLASYAAGSPSAPTSGS